jgi:hypothetical protein
MTPERAAWKQRMYHAHYSRPIKVGEVVLDMYTQKAKELGVLRSDAKDIVLMECYAAEHIVDALLLMARRRKERLFNHWGPQTYA